MREHPPREYRLGMGRSAAAPREGEDQTYHRMTTSRMLKEEWRRFRLAIVSGSQQRPGWRTLEISRISVSTLNFDSLVWIDRDFRSGLRVSSATPSHDSRSNFRGSEVGLSAGMRDPYGVPMVTSSGDPEVR